MKRTTAIAGSPIAARLPSGYVYLPDDKSLPAVVARKAPVARTRLSPTHPLALTTACPMCRDLSLPFCPEHHLRSSGTLNERPQMVCRSGMASCLKGKKPKAKEPLPEMCFIAK